MVTDLSYKRLTALRKSSYACISDMSATSAKEATDSSTAVSAVSWRGSTFYLLLLEVEAARAASLLHIALV